MFDLKFFHTARDRGGRAGPLLFLFFTKDKTLSFQAKNRKFPALKRSIGEACADSFQRWPKGLSLTITLFRRMSHTFGLSHAKFIQSICFIGSLAKLVF